MTGAVWSGGSADVLLACPVCHCKERSLFAAQVFDHLDPKGPDRWTVYRCKSCRSLYPSPRPSLQSLPAAYQAYYTHGLMGDHEPRSNAPNGQITRLINGYLNRRFGSSFTPSDPKGYLLFRMIEPLRLKLDFYGAHLFACVPGSPRRLLDVGCGNGEFIHRVQRMGWTGVGIDPDPSAVAACRLLGVEAYEGFIDTPSAATERLYDVITLRHTVEHSADIAELLRGCQARLSPGGMLWLAWPNPTSLGATFYRAAWRGLEVPRHLCIPSRRSMQQMLALAGFERVRAIRRGHHGRGTLGESAAIAAMRPGWFNVVRSKAAAIVALLTSLASTFSSGTGEELVMVAFAPLEKKA